MFPRRKALWILAALVLLAGVLRLGANPLGHWILRNRLDTLPGLETHFDEVRVTFFPFTVTTTQLTFFQLPRFPKDEPLFYCERATALVRPRSLLERKLVGVLTVRRPKVSYIRVPPRKTAEQAAPKERLSPLQELTRISDRAPDYRIEHLDMQDAEFLFRDDRMKETPEIWAHGIELTLENFSSKAQVASDYPSVLALRGTVQRSGVLTVFFTLDPSTKDPTLAGQVRLRALEISSLHDVLRAGTGVMASQGTVDVFIPFRANDGRLQGQIETVLRNAEIAPAKEGLTQRAKAAVANLALSLFEDDTPEGDEVITAVLPFEARLKSHGIGAIDSLAETLERSGMEALRQRLPGAPALKKKHAPAPREPEVKLTPEGDLAELPQTPTGLYPRGTIAELQKALGQTADGRLGAKTQQAIAELQEKHGLAKTGYPDRRTLAAVGLDGPGNRLRMSSREPVRK